jgi:transposase
MTHPQLTHFAGFDWAGDHHDVIITDTRGTLVADFRFEHSASGWKLWKEKISKWPALGVAIETSFGAVVEQLIDSGVTVFPVTPSCAKRYRERKHPSGTKTDRHDAWALSDALRTDGHAWRPLGARDPIIEELRMLCRDEVALIEERTALVNQARQAAREYYPAVLEAFDDWTVPYTWAFIERFPDTQALLKAGRREWEKFLHTHKLWRPKTAPERLAVLESAKEWFVAEHMVKAKRLYLLTKIKQLRALEAQLEEYRSRIQEVFDNHPDSGMFGSLPGAGGKLAPRLLGEIGSDRALYADVESLQSISGTAPVNYQSGKLHKVRMRRACNLHLRHTLHLFCDLSRARCTWAMTYYEGLKKRGKTHAQALRCLGQRWLKIIFRMWHSRELYDGELHTRNMLQHGSWVLQNKPA